MFSQLSPAQAPPIDVLCSIIKWVVSEERSPFHGDTRKLYRLRRLLTVSSAWREVALEFQWQEVRLNIGGTHSGVELICPEWVKSEALPQYVTNLLREIHITVFLSDIVHGIAHKPLTDYTGPSNRFMSVKKLTVVIKDEKNHNSCTRDLMISNTLEFAKILKYVTPMATTVEMVCNNRVTHMSSDNNNIREFDEDVLGTLTDALYANTKCANLKLHKVNISNQLTIDSIPPLSKIRLHYAMITDKDASLVHKSSSTLQYLDIELYNANMLICDINGDAVVYPNLQHLQILGATRNSIIGNAVSPETVPFPALKTLRVNSLYPFRDDVLFRGNSATLEYLSMSLDYNTIAMLKHTRVFESRHKALQYVNIDDLRTDMSTSASIKVNINTFLNSMVGAATRLSARKLRTAKAFIEAAPHGQGFRNISVFGIRLVNLSVIEVLEVLKSFPSLYELRSGVRGLGSDLERIEDNELPDHIATTYRNVGKNLQVLRTNSVTSAEIDYYMLLALVCPKLWRIQVKSGSLKNARAKVTEALDSQLYSKYTPDLNRVLNAIRK